MRNSSDQTKPPTIIANAPGHDKTGDETDNGKLPKYFDYPGPPFPEQVQDLPGSFRMMQPHRIMAKKAGSAPDGLKAWLR